MCVYNQIKIKKYHAAFQQSIYDIIECSHNSTYEVVCIFEKQQLTFRNYEQ